MISNVKTASTDTLLYAQRDLRDVIQVQEPAERQFPGTCKKLGQYHDDLAAVNQELARRRGADCCTACKRPL